MGIELPRGWKDAVASAAEQLNCPMRYLWIAAIDLLMSLPRDELERRALTYELLARKHFDQLAAARPGQCQALVAEWVTSLAAAISAEPGAAGTPHRGHRNSQST